MVNHLLKPPFSLLLLLLLFFCLDKSTGSTGEGKSIWQEPETNPISRHRSLLQGTFPPGFLWGSGTSAFQTEGAWRDDGKGSSIWDYFTHSSRGNFTRDTADVASNSYNCREEDLEALEYLGVKTYSFSLSWPRIFPGGNPAGIPNAAAVEHYSHLIDRLLEKKIEPIVTLYHSDLPLVLQEKYGGWKNDILVELFQGYAAFCFRTFGVRVKYWITIHNPYLVAVQGYGTGVHAPAEKGGLPVSLVVAHNLIKAHAKVWQTYNTQFRATQRGKVSITLGSHWIEPNRGRATAANVELCQQSSEAVLGWFAGPIFGEGDYPDSLKKKYGEIMPTFAPEEKLWVQKSADFFAVAFGPNNFLLGRELIHNGQTVTPDLRRLLRWIKLEYADPPVLVAEGGWFSDATVGREDTVAIYLMKSFVNQVLQAIRFDDVRVFGYIAWSLVDGFEWNYGYSMRRGLFYVDMDQPTCARTPKTSAQYYKQVVAANGFPSDESATEVKGHFPCKFQWGVADSTLQVQFYPFSPQFNDPQLYKWKPLGDGSLDAVPGVKLQSRPPQCTDFLAIRSHLRLLASTEASHYRFALNWSRILPKGDRSQVNTEALRYYRCLLTDLEKMGMEAMVIIYHPTHRDPNLALPLPLHESGGWLNYSTVEAFRDYAALCYEELGKWVRYWITINEPNRLIDVYSTGAERHQAAHHLLLAHAKAFRTYEKDFYEDQQALVSLALHADWAKPANFFMESHQEAAERFLLFEISRFMNPLLGTTEKKGEWRGDYPLEMKTYSKERAQVMGLPESTLPSFTESEREELRGALSFIALSHFTTRLVSPDARRGRGPHMKSTPDHGCLTLSDPTWPSSSLGQALVPGGLRQMLRWVSSRYGNGLPIIITASGIDDETPIQDVLRQHYLKNYLQEALKAIQLDGVNLQGFYMWRLKDRHAPQYGLFSSSQHQTKPKGSVALYREIITNSGFPDNYTKPPCKFEGLKESCSSCEWILRNKSLLVFGVCIFITTGMLVQVVVSALTLRRDNKQIRTRCKYKISHIKGKDGPLMLLCPTTKY